jgi:hypothetical protein
MDHLADAPIANILILAGVIFLAVGLFGRVGGFIGSIFGNIEAGKNSRVLAGVLGSCLIVGGGWLHEDSHKPATSAPPPTAPVTNTPASSAVAPATVPSTAVSTPPAATPVLADPPKAKAAISHRAPDVKTAAAPPATAAPAMAADRENLPPSNAVSPINDHLIGTWNNLTPDQGGGLKRIEIVRVGQDVDAHIWHSCSSGECDYGIHRLVMSGTAPAYDFTRGNRRYVGSLNLYTSGVVLLSIDILEPGTSNRWHHNRVLAKSTLSEKMQGAFAKYLAAPNQKAFAMSPAGSWYCHRGMASLENAAKLALEHCQEYGKPGCRVILLNNDAAE